jgi:hypothetical protein
MMVLTNEVVVSGDCCFFCNACGLAVLSCPSLGFLETKNDFGEKGWRMILVKRDGCFCSLFVNDSFNDKRGCSLSLQSWVCKRALLDTTYPYEYIEKMTVLRSHGTVSWIIPHCHSSQCFCNHW